MNALRRIAGFLKPHWGKAAVLLVTVTAGVIAELVPPLLIQHIIDDVLTPHGSVRLLVWLVFGLLGARALIWLSEVSRGWLSAWLGGRISADVRRRLFHHLQYLPLRFFNSWKVGHLMSRVTSDGGRLEEFLANTVPLLFVNALMVTGILVFMFRTDLLLALCILVPVPPIVVAAFSLWDRLRLALDRQASSWSRLSAHLIESLAGIQVMKAFSQEPREAMRFDRLNRGVRDTTTLAERQSFVLFSLIYFLMNLAVLLVWYIGGREVITGKLRVGELLAVIAYLWMLYWPLQWLGQISGSVGQALVGAERIFEILDTPTELHCDPRALPMSCIDGGVTFRGVTFGYEAANPVLHEIDFDVVPGEMIGIVGRSGAGKTTLMHLLCRFYDVNQGAIELDGVDIRNIRLEDLRGHVGVVAQDPFVFSGTIAENIRFGRPTASFDEVVASAIAASAHSFIMAKPDGYDTEVGERGRRLSGGEKQRIAIARAILRNPRILILDEATSLLDTRSEVFIQDAIGLAARNRTTFVIAHRLSTVRSADRLIVLDNGRIVEVGTHEELTARGGIYRRFAQAQRTTRSLIKEGEGRR